MTVSAAQVDLITFIGPPGPSPVERAVAGIRQAAALDLVSLAQACDRIGRVVAVVADGGGAERLRRTSRESPATTPVHVDLDAAAEPFHFGRRLASVIERFSIRHAVYFGAGAAPLLSPHTLTRLCDTLLAQPAAGPGTGTGVVSANNFWSADFLGWTPASAIRHIDLPPRRDNQLAVLLQRQAGLTREDLPPSAGSLFDIDTPADVAILNLHHGTYPHARAALQAIPWGQASWPDSRPSSLSPPPPSFPLSRESGPPGPEDEARPTDQCLGGADQTDLAALMPPLVSPGAEVCLVGRVSNSVFGGLRQDLACRLRIYAEERGMQASGRDRRGEVRSLLGMFLEQVGARRFFAALADLGSDAVFMDTRPIFRHMGWDVSTADRFYSDLGCVERIRHPELRSFTAAARAARVPVALGGQSLVGGGLWALTEAAWERADAGLLPPLG